MATSHMMRAICGVTLAALLFGSACASEPVATSPTSAPSAAATGPPIRVLMLTATAGFRHDSILTARQVMAGLAASAGEFTITATEDIALLSASSLAAFDVVFFANTSGELPLTADHKSALIDFVNGGKGFVGTHSATDTLYGWPEYGRLVGAYFKEHPWTQTGTLMVEDQTHPATRGLADRFPIMEEFYTFQENPRPRVQILLSLDPGSVGSSGDYPVAWAQPFGSGRTYYNALGHFDTTWTDARFQQQLRGAFRWVARR